MAERLCVRNQDIQQMKDMQWKVFVIEHDDFNAHVYPVSNLTICIDQSNRMIVLHIFAKVLGFSPSST